MEISKNYLNVNIKNNDKTDDNSNWRTRSRVANYLKRIDKIPHRKEGEQVLCEIIPKETKRILDLGTGNGRLVKLIKEKIPNLEAVVLDFSPYMINELNKELGHEKNVKIINHDLSFSLPNNLKKFDAIVSSFAIHHLTHKRKRDLYFEIFSLIKKGGVFCNLDHVASDSIPLSNYFRRQMKQNIINNEHNKRLAKTELQLRWLSEIGFKEVDCYWKWLEFALIIGWK